MFYDLNKKINSVNLLWCFIITKCLISVDSCKNNRRNGYDHLDLATNPVGNHCEKS